MLYDKEIVARVMKVAQYYLANKCSIRGVSKALGIPKTTVHKDLAEKLPEINVKLYMKVRKILNEHKDEAPYKAGEATRQKWQKINKQGS